MGLGSFFIHKKPLPHQKELKREAREGPEKEHQGQDDENKGTEDATLCPTVGREERDVWIWGERYRDEI